MCKRYVSSTKVEGHTYLVNQEESHSYFSYSLTSHLCVFKFHLSSSFSLKKIAVEFSYIPLSDDILNKVTHIYMYMYLNLHTYAYIH